MVNDLRDRQNDREQESIRSICSNSTISLNNLNQKVQESKRLSRNIQVRFERFFILPNNQYLRMPLTWIAARQLHRWTHLAQ